jgi:hypothetical protein
MNIFACPLVYFQNMLCKFFMANFERSKPACAATGSGHPTECGAAERRGVQVHGTAQVQPQAGCVGGLTKVKL